MFGWPLTRGGVRSTADTAAGRVTGLLRVFPPLLFGVPVALGIAISVIRLLGTGYPDLGWATTVNSDGEELYLGHTIYQNPAHGYTGALYTPLYPTLLGLLDHIRLWSGWAPLVTIGASVALIALVARVAYAPTASRALSSRVLAVLAAAGIGCIAYWCVSSVTESLLDIARVDQLAWAFALSGLIAVAGLGPAPPGRRVVLAALLLSAAFWTKQTTIAVTLLAFAWVIGLTLAGALHRRAALLFTAVLLSVNLSLLLALALLTHGWELYFNFEMPLRQIRRSYYNLYVIEGLRSSIVALAFVALAWLACALDAAGSWRRHSLRQLSRASSERLRRLLLAEDPTGRRVLLLGLYVVFGFLLALYFRRKPGTETNEFLGVVWALGLLAAAGWRVAQRRASTAARAGICVLLLFALVQIGQLRALAAGATVKVPPLERAVYWPQVPAQLRAWARHHTLYLEAYPDLNVPRGGPLYTDYYTGLDLLAAGTQPMYLVRALLDRRFDGVAPFLAPHSEPRYESAFGKWEENYTWKLNEVIAARYAPSPAAPPGVLERRPGPERAAWMRHCFAPFPAGGASFRIRRGGGFWCSFSPNRLWLVRTPAPLSEVLTTRPVHLAGTIKLRLQGGSARACTLILENAGAAIWTARVAESAGDSRELTISTFLGRRSLGSTLVTAAQLPGGMREVQLDVRPAAPPYSPPLPAGPGAVTLTTPAASATLALLATDGVEFDLSAARLRGS
jgi:hypothetical protein